MFQGVWCEHSAHSSAEGCSNAHSVDWRNQTQSIKVYARGLSQLVANRLELQVRPSAPVRFHDGSDRSPNRTRLALRKAVRTEPMSSEAVRRQGRVPWG